MESVDFTKLSGDLIQGVAKGVLGEIMSASAREYRNLLERAGLAFDISLEPQVYFTLSDSWTNVIIRYLVAARERRRWASRLVLEVTEAIAEPEHRDRIKSAYPRLQLQTVGSDSNTPQ